MEQLIRDLIEVASRLDKPVLCYEMYITSILRMRFIVKSLFVLWDKEQ